MKRPSITLAATLIVLQLYSSLWALPTTEYDAEMVVTGWLKADPQPLGMLLGRSVENVETFTDNHGEPVYYIVYLYPSGFAIVSANDSVEPIIGFANSSRYDPSPESPLGALVTKDLNGRMSAVRDTFRPLSMSPNAAFTRVRQKWSYFISLAETQEGEFELMGQEPICNDNPSDVRVAPLIRSKWDQKLIVYETQSSLGPACYNYYTPQILPNEELSWDKGDEYYGNPDNYYCGCVATAMAQSMLYYQWPVDAPIQPDFNDSNNTVGIGETDLNGEFVPVVPRVYRNLLGGDEHGGKYEWQDMDFVPDQNTTLAQRKAIGAICHDAGVAAKTNYTADVSSADLFNAKEAFVNNFRYSNAVWGSNGGDSLSSGLIGMILPNLDAKRPVILGISGENAAHSAICDGYGYDVAETLYHHLNMGWSGADDCWYNLPIIESRVAGYEYETVFECIYNISKDGNGEIISGRVLNADNEPADANIVYLEYEGRLIETAVTDANGIFTFVDVNSNTTYTVWVEGRDFSRQEVTTGTSRDGLSASGNRWAVDFPSSRKILYVDRQAAAGSGDGSSWTDAFVDLQDALDAAVNSPGIVGEIWVAAGTYGPDRGTKDRSLSFQLVDGVGLYGGFAGDESYRQQRNPRVNITTLSGDLNNDDGEGFSNRNDNSRHVVNGSGTHGTAIIDGFTITGGNADAGSEDSMGGGMYIPGASPSVRNCIFRSNSAQFGGGVYSFEAEPALSNCTFTGNSADYGAGIYTNSSDSTMINCEFTGNEAKLAGGADGSSAGGIYNFFSDLILTDCVFSGNSADYGAGIYNDGSSLTLTNCEFTGNEAKLAGGADGSSAGGIYNFLSDLISTNCTFTGNSADHGAGILNNISSATLTNCELTGNMAKLAGGADGSSAGGIYNYFSDLISTDCTFTANSADYGAGIYSSDSSATLTNCELAGNVAKLASGADGSLAGGIYNYYSDLISTDCIFAGNLADYGAGIFNNSSSPTITNCTFNKNSVRWFGGGMLNSGSDSNVTNCIFSENTADDVGGGIYNEDSNPTVLNCTFSENSASWGAGIFNNNNSTPILTNCNLIRNQAQESGGGIYDAENCRTVMTNCIVWDNSVVQIAGNAGVSYCDVQGGWTGEGNNNIDEDPLFADINNGDYHLKSQTGRWDPIGQSWVIDNVTSPCIDAGNPDIPVGGEPEPNGGRINMGAHGGTVEASKSP
jgi:parallel beta-helix repeat protein